MDLSKDDVLKIMKIIDESGYDDVRLEIGDFKLHVQKQGAVGAAAPRLPAEHAETSRSATQVKAPAPAPAAAPAEVAIPAGMVAVRSPMLGTFYRAPSPGEKSFVEVGDKVGPEDTVCLVEVMKLFNSIKAGVAGRVASIVVENGVMVEHAQILMLIEPERAAA